MWRPPPDDEIRLIHVRDAAKEALEYASGRSREDLDTDSQLVRALERLVEIIGEAAGKISHDTVQELPDVPWGEIRGMRNWLAHAYFKINSDYLWRTVTEELPQLLEVVTRVLEGQSEVDETR